MIDTARDPSKQFMKAIGTFSDILKENRTVTDHTVTSTLKDNRRRKEKIKTVNVKFEDLEYFMKKRGSEGWIEEIKKKQRTRLRDFSLKQDKKEAKMYFENEVCLWNDLIEKNIKNESLFNLYRRLSK